MRQKNFGVGFEAECANPVLSEEKFHFDTIP